MAIRNIIFEGDPLLREKSKPVTEFDERLAVLIDDMIETMLDADGAGLAAPQVGILKQVCVVSVDSGKTIYEMVNPVIVRESGSQTGFEGCLSIKNFRGRVCRPKKVTVECADRHGNPQTLMADGYLAVAFCHEIDHLNGILFTDKLADK